MTTAGPARATRMALVLDCADPERLARFWTKALGYRLSWAEGAYVGLVPEAGQGPELMLQRVPEHKGGKNRMHLDIRTDALQPEIDRLAALGARKLRPEVIKEAGFGWVVMTDPDGNEFCVCVELPSPHDR
ncbi:MAG: VOC family protein [Acidimicrobiales bacterium]